MVALDLHNRIPQSKLRKQREVPVPRQERVDAMCGTDRGDPGVMNYSAGHPRTLNESTQHLEEIARLTNQPT